MNPDEWIEAALRRQPADERTYDEPMAALVSGGGVQRVRPVTPSRMRTSALPALAGLALVLALGAGLAVVGLPAAGGPSGAPQTDGGPTPAARQPLIGCSGGSPGFSPDLLAGSGGAETGDSVAAGVLREFTSSPEGPGVPAHGWYLIESTPDEVQFLARVPRGGPSDYWQVVVKRGTGGQFAMDGWSLDGYGGCLLETVPPAGYGPARWTLDPSVPFAHGASELHILVTEQRWYGCFPTEVDRILVNVAYTDRAVIVTVVARSPQGAQSCPLPPPETPYVVELGQPVGRRDLQDGSPWPARTVAGGGHPVDLPTPTPYPSSRHMPMDCTGEEDGPGSFKAATQSATFDVYCAVLPAGWQRQSMSDYQQHATLVTVTYSGPNGETLALSEGDLCSGGQSACATAGASSGTAMFGDREGRLFEAPPGADFALYVAPGQSPSWKATGKGMSLETFKALTAALIIVGNGPSPAPTITPSGSSSPSGSMQMRESHTATLLLDGRVLIAGGAGDTGVMDSAKLYDPRTGTFTATGSMMSPRDGHTATLLPDGRVLIVGGLGQDQQKLASAELYDPKTGKFTATGSMLEGGRNRHSATRLANGRVLVAGGGVDVGWFVAYIASAELYDPTTGTFTATGSMTIARYYPTATLLEDGRVLMAGGIDNTEAPNTSAELYDPTTGTFTATGSMTIARFYPTATRLADGRVLMVGGVDDTVYTEVPDTSAELYDPRTGTFTATGSMTIARFYPTATLLADGRVLMVGGVPPGSGEAEVYDPKTGKFTATGSIVELAQVNHRATLLADGRVLVTGGYGRNPDPANAAWAKLYDPTTGTFSATG